MSASRTCAQKIELLLRAIKTCSEDAMAAKVQEWLGVSLLNARDEVKKSCNGKCAITHKACIYDIAHFATLQLGASTCPQALLEWGKLHNVDPRRMHVEISHIDKDKLHVFKEGTQWMARKKTRLSAHNIASLERSIKATGIKGAALDEVFTEYHNAYQDVFMSPHLIIGDSNVWHVGAAPATI